MNRLIVNTAVAAAAVATTLNARADIAGFAPGSFGLVQSDAGNAPLLMGSGTGVQMTTGSSNQFRAIWFNQKQSVSQFSAQFTFRAIGYNDTFNRDGIAFVVQNSGPNAIGTGRFAYDGLGSSVAATTEVVLHGGQSESFSGVYSNGLNNGGSLPTMPVNAASGDPIRVSINYDGTFLNVHYTDLTTGDSWSSSPFIIGSIANKIGSSDAYVGFTAGVLGANRGELFISDFSYAVPSPSTAAVLGLGGYLSKRRRR